MSQKRLLERKPRLKPVNNEFPSSWFLTLTKAQGVDGDYARHTTVYKRFIQIYSFGWI